MSSRRKKFSKPSSKTHERKRHNAAQKNGKAAAGSRYKKGKRPSFASKALSKRQTPRLKNPAKPAPEGDVALDRKTDYKVSRLKRLKKSSSPPKKSFRPTGNTGTERRLKDKKNPRERKRILSTRKSPFSATTRTPNIRPAPAATEKRKGEEIRLNKYIADSGIGSRRKADEMIQKGLISVNREVVTKMGYKVKPGDVVRYEDRILKAEKPMYVLLNKPKGFITTTNDPKDRKTVVGLIAQAGKERLYPVGRLDRNTTGLLLLTNDGELTNRLTHPSYRAKKIYKAELNRALTRNDFQKILKGVWLDEGKAVVDDLAVVSTDKKTIGLELHIGWNRVVHRIFGALGYEVLKLDRTVYADLSKKDLPRGKWRFLSPEEVVRLKHF